MPTNFPASLDSLTNPLSTDTLNSPSHSGQHADANDAIEALQAKVGVDNSAVTTSLDYRVNALETAPAPAAITISSTPPTSPAPGDLWFDEDTAATFIYYDSTWVEVGASATLETPVPDPSSAPDGYVLTADGAGGIAWEAVPTGGITVISSGSLSGSALDLTSIPATYKALELILTNASFNTSNNWGLQLNGQTGPSNGYAYVRQFTTTNGAAQSGTSFQIDNSWGASSSVAMRFYFPNYSVSSYQMGYYYSMDQSNGLGGYAVFNYRDSQFAINRIRIFSLSGATFDAGTYELRGIK